MFILCLVIFALVTQDCSAQEDDEGPYRGKLIGKLNSYHHQVSGDVYAVDEWTVLLVNFNYDGTGDDTFFWAGDSGRPGPQGFIVPDEHGKTNILERYNNAEVRLRLPEGKRLSRLRWLAVYDIDSQNTFGDVYVADDFEPPAPRDLAPLAGPRVSSRPLRVLTAASLLIPELRYDGEGEAVYFWAGVGPQPSIKGFQIPDEDGYLEPLRRYEGEDVVLELPGGRTVADLAWLAVYDTAARAALASVLLPAALNVPPPARGLHAYRSALPNCKQLHRDYQVAWEVFGPQVTFELIAALPPDGFMAWGVSGAAGRSRMLGADVAVVGYNETDRRAVAVDYNITAVGPCVRVLGQWAGACPDAATGGAESLQAVRWAREDGLTAVTFRRLLAAPEPGDRAWEPGAAAVWALGRLDADGAPHMHDVYPRVDLRIDLAAPEPQDDCYRFTLGAREPAPAWERAQLFDPSVRVFTFAVGPAGGARGRAARSGGAGALAWYVNGQLAPDLQLRRGLAYALRARGGADPHAAARYHPLVLTAEPRGGLERLAAAGRPAPRVLAGAARTRRGALAASAAGALCEARAPPGADPRRLARAPSFRAYNRSLLWDCPPGAPAELRVTPDSSWPDLVYYNSFTHPDMGGRIFVVDRHRRSLGRAASPAPRAAPPAPPAPLAPLAALALRAYLAGP